MPAVPPSSGQRLFRLLLRVLPGDFRAEFGEEMARVFEDQHEEAARRRRTDRLRLWLTTVAGVLRIAPAQHADIVRQDLTYASRMLSRTPAFTATTVLALALGIGAATAVFVLVRAVILQPLPVASPERLVWLATPSFSYPVTREVERRLSSLDGVFGWSVDRRNVTWDASPEAADVLFAQGDIYRVLGVGPALGRLLAQSDDRSEPAVAVLSYDAWQRRFGGAFDIVGRRLRLEHTLVTIVGVAPRGFFGVAPGLAPELTVPASLAARLDPDDADLLEQDSASWLHVMGRLREGRSLSDANAELRVAWPQILDATTPASVPASQRTRALARQAQLMPGATGFSRVRRQFERPLWALFALVGLLLLAAAGTVANMMLSRTLARGHELSVRRAIGASRGRLLRQLVTESLLISCAGAGVGALLGVLGSRALVTLLSTADTPIVVDAPLDLTMLGWVALLAVAVALALTAICASCALRRKAGDALRAAPRSAGGSRAERRASGVLVSAQVAIAVTLIAGASLFATDLHRLLAAPAGFDRTAMLLVHTDAVFAGHRGQGLLRFYDAARAQLAALPGVVSASYSKVPPVSYDLGAWTQRIAIDGREVLTTESDSEAYFNAVSPGYFATTGTRVVAGRDIDSRDVAAGQPVVMVNQLLAARAFGGESPLGRQIVLGRDASRRHLFVVGVVEDAKYEELQEAPRATAYLPIAQAAEMLGDDNLVLEVRTAGPPAAVAAAARDALRQVDAGTPVRVETLEARIAESLVRERALTSLATTLGAVALILAAAALYGLMAYGVTVRTRELGVRAALGATPGAIGRLILNDALRVGIAGVGAGLALALALGSSARSLLLVVAPDDPGVLSAAALLVLAVSLAVALGPAWRGARANVCDALRDE